MHPTDARTADLFGDTLPALRPASPAEATGFEIGWDFAHHRLTPPTQELAVWAPVRQGWLAGSAVFGKRALEPTPQVRSWLRLRLDAWRCGAAFEPVQVTPHFIAQLDAAVCPITRTPLSRASGGGADAVVDRLNSQAGYAAGNLATLSRRVQQAKAALGWAEAMAASRQLELSGLDRLDGLDSRQWQRLAVLMSFVTPLPHEQAACLPLSVVPPNRVRMLNPAQALQAVMTLAFALPQAVAGLRALMALVPAAARHDFQVFVLTLQARRLAIGPAPAGAEPGLELRHALEDLWSDAAVNRRWQRFVLQLDEAACERLVRAASRRGLGGNGWQWLPRAAATDGWALASGGHCGPRPGWART